MRLTASEAATVAREVALRAARQELPGIPSPHVIRLSSDGDVHIEGPVASGREVERAARLLEALLPGFDAPPELRVPGALRLVIARALGILDLPRYPSLESFTDALTRFATADTVATVRAIAAGWRAAVEQKDAGAEHDDVAPVAADQAPPLAPASGELTISDIRRARRATRLTLAEISERSRIPVNLLREFEWGYFANWPAGFYGRTQVIRYARAAGLDEKVVVRAVLPLLDESSNAAAAMPFDAAPSRVEAVAVEETRLVRVDARPPAAAVARHSRRRPAWAAALAIPALIAIGFVPALWDARQDPAVGDVRQGEEAVTDQRVPPRQERGTAGTATAERGAPPQAPAAMDPQRRPAAVPADGLPDAAFSPAFATAGSAMFYHSGMGPGSAIMRADTDGRGAVLRVTRVVNGGASNFHARPSPDGAKIAFDSDRDGARGVYIADADGRNVERISGDGFAAVPSWAPDGGSLAFVRAEPDRPRVWNIWTIDLASGETTRVTSHKVGQPWGAAWFPDGKRIAYSHEDRLIVRTLDGSRQAIFKSPVRGRLVRTPAVAPDGRRVIFQVYRDGVWLLDVPSGKMRKVLADPSAEEFTWSPDGRRVAYHSRRSGTWGVWYLHPSEPANSK